MIEDVMHTGAEIPKVNDDAPLSAALVEMTRKGLGMTTVVDDQGRLLGIFTDGDLRRVFDRGVDVHSTKIGDVMTRRCKTVNAKTLAAEALQLMEKHKINALPVVGSDGNLIGAFNMHDLLRAGVV